MTYRLIYKHKEIGTISDVHLFHEAYVGAIYRHFGKSYLVTAHTADEVLLEDADPHLRTEGIFILSYKKEKFCQVSVMGKT